MLQYKLNSETTGFQSGECRTMDKAVLCQSFQVELSTQSEIVSLHFAYFLNVWSSASDIIYQRLYNFKFAIV